MNGLVFLWLCVLTVAVVVIGVIATTDKDDM